MPQIPSTSSSPFSSASNLARAALLLLNLLFLLLAAAHHPLWRDETQAWLLARDSSSLSALLRNLRYEGHPPLWHLILFPLAHLSPDPNWMKLPNLLFAAATSGLILFTLRLALPVRAALVFSYFLLFEYGTLTRNYMAGIFLVLAATLLLLQPPASLRSTHGNTRLWTVPVLLALAALSSASALILAACAFTLWLAWELDLLSGPNLSRLRPALPAHALRLLPGTILFAAAALTSVLLIRPPADTGVFLEFPQYIHTPKAIITSASQILLQSLLPIPLPTHAFWNLPWYEHLPKHSSGLVGWLLFAALLAFFRHNASRLFFAGGSVLFIAQMILARRIFMRSEGWIFILLILTLLLDAALTQRELRSPKASPRWRPALLGLILAAQVYGGLFAFVVSLRYPFTRSLQAANYLRAHHLDHAPLVFEPDYVSPSILAYLDLPSTYSLELHHPTSFTVWNRDEFLNRHIPSPAELATAASASPSITPGPPILITGKPLTPAEQQSLHLHLLAAFNNAICTIDNYYLYR